MAYRAWQLFLGGLLGVAAWNQVTVSGSAPSARHTGACAMDSSDRMWIYGGIVNGGGSKSDEVWRLDTVAQSWTQVSVTGSPPIRYFHSATIDSNDVMWIFGGKDVSSVNNNQLFTLNTATEAWAEVVATGSGPTARNRHSAAMDSSDRMWVFGGYDNSVKFNDLYYLDTPTENWVPVTASGTLPSARHKHVAVMDSSNRMWIFGGIGSSLTLNDLHVLDTASESWTEVVANNPVSRQFHVAVAGSPEIMWVWSGCADSSGNVMRSDLQYLGPGGEVWTEVTADTSPPLRWKSYFARDSQNRMWLFGGSEDLSASDLSDLWYLELQGTTTTASTSSTTTSTFSTTTSTFSTTTSSTRTATSSSSITTSVSSVTSSSSSSTLSSSSTITSSTSTTTSTTSSTNTATSSSSTTASSTRTATSISSTSTSSTRTATSISSTTTSTSISSTSTSSTRTATSISSTTTSSTRTTTSISSTSTSSTRTATSISSTTTSSTRTATSISSTTTSSSSMATSVSSVTSSSSSSTSSISIASTSSFSTTPMTGSSTTSSSSITSSSSRTTTSLSTFSSSSSTTSSSSITTVAGSGGISVAEVLEANARSLITQLSSDNVTTALTPLGRMTAVKLTDQPPEAGFAMARHAFDNSISAVFIPTETLQNGSYGAMVITTFNGEASKALMGRGAPAMSSAGNPLSFATDAVDVSLFGFDLFVGDVTSAKPILLKLSTANLESSLLCAYQLEDGTWSTEGVRWATAEELEQFSGVVDTSGAWCATFHLSIFAIFVDVLLDCTNINVLSPENLREIIERPDWWTRPPSLCLWLLVAVLLLLLAAGVLLDASRSALWQAEFFLTETPGFPQGSCCRCRGDCTTRRNKSQRPSPDMLAAMQELKKAQPFSKMQESILCQNTLREVSLQHGLHTNLIEQHIWGAEGWVQGSLAIQKSAFLKAVALRVKDNLPSAYVRVHRSRLRCWFSTFVTTHPLFEILQFDLHVTAAQRAKIFMDCTLGSLAFVALFFSVDGSAVAARSPEDCHIEQTSFLWLIFVASFSIALNFIPRSLFQSLAFSRFVHVESPADRYWKLRIHHLKHLRFWTLGACLTVLHVLIIMAFLANLDPADEWKWLFSLALVVVRKLLLVPSVACIISGVVSEVGGVSKRRQVIFSPPKKFGLNVDDLAQFGGSQSKMQDEAEKSSIWNEKVRDLAGRGLTLRQLLDFYADLVCQPRMMPHFDPNCSTTHDVVRHAIIPSSMQLREARTFAVQVHRAVGLECSDPGCLLRVCRGDSEPMLKPWKGGSSSVRWDETVLLQDVLPEEGMYFAVRGLVQNKAGQEEVELFSILPSCEFWHGSTEIEVRLGAGALVASIVPCDSLEEASAIMESSDAKLLKEDSENMEENAKPQPVTLAISICHPLIEKDAQDEGRSKGFAYATSINGGRPCLAQKMVTHSWGNKFCHLISAIFADALEEETYDIVEQLLMSRDFQGVSARLQQKNTLDVPYWVCAFSVNQHAGICARAPPCDSMGHEITVCSCSTAKHFEGDLSEMNKFDDMMAFLKQHHRQKSQVRLEQVVAMEIDFSLLTRVWCVAELVEADRLHLHQAVKTHSASSLEKCVDHLLHLDVREAQASFPSDKDLVLSKIEDVHVFNENLRSLMLQRLGTFLAINQVTMTAAAALDDVLGAALSILMGS